MLLVIVYLFCYYASFYLFTKTFETSGDHRIKQKEEAQVLFKYRTLVIALSLLPSLLLGFY